MSETKTIQSVARAAALLERVGQAPEGLSVQQLADQTGLKAPTVHHLLKTLTAAGLCERTTRPVRYRIGPAVTRLAACRQRSAQIARVEAAMRELAEALPDATVVFARPAGEEIVAVRRISPDRPGLIQRPAHQPMGPYTSASGLAWQAFGPAEDLWELRTRWPIHEYGLHQWSDEAQLDAFLDGARAAGALVAPDRSERFTRIAAPVYAPGGEPAGVLGISLPAGSHHPDGGRSGGDDSDSTARSRQDLTHLLIRQTHRAGTADAPADSPERTEMTTC
jgi:DNA-binding IclR family transcriptional regulator